MIVDTESWVDRAACRGMDVELFVIPRPGARPAPEAVAACERCTVADACLAATHRDDSLFRAGMTRTTRRDRRQAAARKVQS